MVVVVAVVVLAPASGGRRDELAARGFARARWRAGALRRDDDVRRGWTCGCDAVLSAGGTTPLAAPRRIAAGRSPGAEVTTPSTAKPPPATAAADAAAAAILPAVTVSKTACARRNEFAARSCRCNETVSYTRTKKLPVCATPPFAATRPVAGNTTASGRDASCRPRTAARQARQWRRCVRSATVCAASASPSTKADSVGARRWHSCPDSIPA
jgi:hypothetical protein